MSDKDSPFGETTRAQVIDEYFRTVTKPITVQNAWQHVYALLLSLEPRTGLAHIYDANHMQPGRTFHKRAQKFTELLCAQLEIQPKDLGANIDFMFKRCLRLFKMNQSLDSGEESDSGEEGDPAVALSIFATRVSEILRGAVPTISDAQVDRALLEIEELADEFFTSPRKRQNVRGEGFEDVIRYLLKLTAQIPEARLRVRQKADALPGFRSPPGGIGRGDTKKKRKLPSPDIAITSADNTYTSSIVTSKWSLRQDRLDQFGQEYGYYRAHRTQASEVEFIFITNEFDRARLEDVLDTTPGAEGFYFHVVAHVNLELLQATHGDSFKNLASYRDQNRLVSLEGLLTHLQRQYGAGMKIDNPKKKNKGKPG